MSERTAVQTYASELVELARWLQKQVDEKRSRVVLRQRAGTGDETVREWRLAEIQSSDLATQIHKRALEDSMHQRGAVQYGLFAYAEGHKSYVDRTFLTIEDAAASSSTALTTLTPPDDLSERAQTSTLVGLLMKHTHASAHLALGQTIDIVRHYKEDSERKDARIRDLEEKHAKVLTMYEELLSMKHERELEMLRAQNSEKRKDHLLDKIDMLVPIAMSKVLPASKTPALGQELMRQLLKSLSRDQLAALVKNLNSEQAALIHEIYFAYVAHEDDLTKKKNGTNGAANGAAGEHA